MARRGVDYRRHGLAQEGKHSVGVARQYCGQLGRPDNRQMAVSLSIANHHASLPVDYRLCLAERVGRGHCAAGQGGCYRRDQLTTKPEIALERMRYACAAGIPRGVADG